MMRHLQWTFDGSCWRLVTMVSGGYALGKSHCGGILWANAFLFVIWFYFSSGATDPDSILIYTSTHLPLVVPYLNRNMIWVNLAMLSIAS